MDGARCLKKRKKFTLGKLCVNEGRDCEELALFDLKMYLLVGRFTLLVSNGTEILRYNILR